MLVSDGTFFATITGVARPFREPGVEAGYEGLPCVVAPCNVPLFDGNPERLKVDSDALDGTVKVDVSTGAVMTNVTGPLDFDHGHDILELEVTLPPVGGITAMAVPAAGPNQFTPVSFNMERFFDTVNRSKRRCGPHTGGLCEPPEQGVAGDPERPPTRRTSLGLRKLKKLAVLQDYRRPKAPPTPGLGQQPLPNTCRTCSKATTRGGHRRLAPREYRGRARVTGDVVETSARPPGVAPFNGATRSSLNYWPPVMLRATLQGAGRTPRS